MKTFDLSVTLRTLLARHECVVIPGFGALIARYREAQMHPVTYQITPPSRSISFNVFLQEEDALLTRGLMQQQHCTSLQAKQYVSDWVSQTKQLLHQQEEVLLAGIGKFFRDIEGQLQFVPIENNSLLAASFGLQPITAAPLLRAKETVEINIHDYHRPSIIYRKQSRTWALVAAMLLLVCLLFVMGLLNSSLQISSLNLQTASILPLIETWRPSSVLAVVPKPTRTMLLPELNDWIVVRAPSDDVPPTSTQLDEPMASDLPTTSDTQHGYFIMVGAFREPQNLAKAESLIRQRFPGAILYKDTTPYFVRIGFKAGDSYTVSLQKLHEARSYDTAFWLLRR